MTEDGMELLAWDYDLAFWRAYLADRPEADRRQRRDLWIGVILMPIFGSLFGGIYAGSVVSNQLTFNPGFAVAGAIMGLAGMGLIFVTGWARRLSPPKAAPSVAFTSVGLRFGDQQRFWNASGQRLRAIHLKEGGPRSTLHLTFAGATSLVIPIPPDLEGAVADLVPTLRWKTPGAQKDAKERIDTVAPRHDR